MAIWMKIFYRNFLSTQSLCHVGLGVSAGMVQRVLKQYLGITIDVDPVWETNLSDIDAILSKQQSAYVQKNASVPITHVVIEAPYANPQALVGLIRKYPRIEFTIRIHSQPGFLQVEAGAVSLIRQYINIQEQNHNFQLSVNNVRCGTFIQQTYRTPALYLPNLYWHYRVAKKPYKPPTKLIRIGSFGALRLLKNHSTAASAAMILARQHGYDLEFYLSVNREEHGKGVLQAIRNFMNNVPGVKLIEVPWVQWPEFRHWVSLLDLHFQVSMSETFNITTADAISEGVPSVVSDAIEWVPSDWQCEIDDPYRIANVGNTIIHDPTAPARGLQHLEDYVNNGIQTWKQWLTGNSLEKIPNHLSRGIR